MTSAALHALARNVVAAAIERGTPFDKKLLRYNEIVTTGEAYAALCCDPARKAEVARMGVCEAVQSCINGDPMHIPKRGPLTLIQDWMTAPLV